MRAQLLVVSLLLGLVGHSFQSPFKCTDCEDPEPVCRPGTKCDKPPPPPPCTCSFSFPEFSRRSLLDTLTIPCRKEGMLTGKPTAAPPRWPPLVDYVECSYQWFGQGWWCNSGCNCKDENGVEGELVTTTTGHEWCPESTLHERVAGDMCWYSEDGPDGWCMFGSKGLCKCNCKQYTFTIS
jgi:hypothetical protein